MACYDSLRLPVDFRGLWIPTDINHYDIPKRGNDFKPICKDEYMRAGKLTNADHRNKNAQWN
jgi:hypothetical protein